MLADLKPKRRNRFNKFFTKTLNLRRKKEIFFESLSQMLLSSVDVVDALESILEDEKNPDMREIIQDIIYEVRNGSSLWSALKDSNIVNSYYISVIKIGEESGNLKENLEMIQEQIEKEKDLKGRIQSASLYPVIVIIILVIVSSLLSIFVLPKLTEVYSSLNIKLPQITQIFIKFGNFMGKYGFVLIPSFIGIFIIILFILFGYKKTKWIGQKILLNFPIIKNILKYLEITRMGLTLNSLMKGGFPIDEALAVLIESTELKDYKRIYTSLFHDIRDGKTLTESMNACKKIDKYFFPYTRQLITTGEQTGNLQLSFLRIAKVYEKKNNDSTGRLTVLFEPLLLIVVWLGVGLMAISIVLPIYSLIGQFYDVNTTQQNNQNTQGPIIISAGSTSTKSTSSISSKSVSSSYSSISSSISSFLSSMKRLQVSKTPTGKLNVRDKIGGSLIMSINEGEIFEYIDYQSGWYLIKVNDSISGWVSGGYVKIL